MNTGLKNADRQYIIQSKWKEANRVTNFLHWSAGKSIKRKLSQACCQLLSGLMALPPIVSKGDKSFREDIAICDSTMLNMYGFKLFMVMRKRHLTDPFSLLITADKAMKYFGKTDVVGKTLSIENFSGSRHDFIITGVMKNPAKNTVTYFK